MNEETRSARRRTDGTDGSAGGGDRLDDQRFVSALPRMPLLAETHPEEAFGSWLRRCAVSHRHRSVADFAASILALEGIAPASDSTDWDCDPPDALVQILSDRGRLPQEQLRALIVTRTPDTLRPHERDAYCPVCFQADLAQRAIYRRRQWLNAWTLTCAVHGCLLWSYEHVAHAKAPQQQSRSLVAADQIRLGVAKLGYVTGFSPPYACWSPALEGSRRQRDLELSQGRWLDPALLTSVVGRSLVLLCGSPEADSLYFVLFGVPRPKEFSWRGDLAEDGVARPETSPRATIRTRLTAAYTAAAIWRVLSTSRRESSAGFTTVAQAMALCKSREWTDRWPVVEMAPSVGPKPTCRLQTAPQIRRPT